MSPLARLLLGLAGSAAIGCGGPTVAPQPVSAATFTAIYPLMFPRSTKGQCNLCHSLPPNQKSNGKLSVGADRAAAYAALVGTTSTSLDCSGKAYLVPGKPDESLLLTKLASPSCGDRMPLGGEPLPEDQLRMIRSWIAAGAQDN